MDYRLLNRIGRGSFGEVYKAYAYYTLDYYIALHSTLRTQHPSGDGRGGGHQSVGLGRER
jgi:serine/threonine protein kinase